MSQSAAFAKQNIAYWSGRAAGYSGVNQQELATGQRRVWGGLLAEQIAAAFPGRQPQSLQVLDVGTGPGFFAILLADMGCRVTAVDYTANMLREARRNAGALAGRIRFAAMDAEALTFADGIFDVVVSRNVTWNLHDPRQAYRQWVRVLRPGGLLLNFDANWYRYLSDGAALAAHARDRANVAALQVADDTAGTDVDAMEAIARQTPLSACLRPAWDAAVLAELGMQADCDAGIWRRVWTREERINNASTPMFMVRAVKPGDAPAARS